MISFPTLLHLVIDALHQSITLFNLSADLMACAYSEQFLLFQLVYTETDALCPGSLIPPEY